ncbi:hypothetical protein [Lentzea sp. NBRC 102530]|uniref:hypothetical protein n=1 Tax=Lentzea sp. NBRC 102530 TaxID=3032201 RepID=UPI0024A35840|nr:hypothetical protein [Lentzea sp. NBRC 102530]GLY52559.1 hypothetical protein Lesp01_62150 [Lentzea sp. NBRC 102530]
MTRWKLVAVLTAVAALGGCSPAQSWAVKLTPTGLPQFVDTGCDAPAVADLRVEQGEKEIWRLEFAQPVRIGEVTVGQKPEGAREKVAWQPPKGDQPVRLSVRQDDDTSTVEFTLDALKDGKVKFDGDYLTTDEFAGKREKC